MYIFRQYYWHYRGYSDNTHGFIRLLYYETHNMTELGAEKNYNGSEVSNVTLRQWSFTLCIHESE